MVVNRIVHGNDLVLGTVKSNMSMCNFSILRCTSAFTSITRKVFVVLESTIFFCCNKLNKLFVLLTTDNGNFSNYVISSLDCFFAL